MSVRSRRITRTAAGALATIALVAPAAAEPRPAFDPPPSRDSASTSVVSPEAATAAPSVGRPIDDGFEWGSAAAGAGGAAALLLLTAAGASTVSRRHQHVRTVR